MGILKRSIALFLGISMMFTFVGCAGSDNEEKDDSLIINYEGAANLPASSNTKWIDSDIYGAIDDSLNISEKDDFYTAVNKEWILEQTKPTNEKDDVSMLMEGEDIVKERLISIVSGQDDPEAFDVSQIDIADEEIEHDKQLVVQFVTAAADWDARNAAGVEPIRKYIDDLISISSLDDMTDYITDINGRNISQQSLVEFQSFAGAIDATTYRCLVMPDSSYVLNDSSAYIDMTFKEHEDKRLTDEIVEDVLTRLGYDGEYARSVLKNCYKLEGMLIDHTNNKLASDPKSYENGMSLDEIAQIAGGYPFKRVYAAYGYTMDNDLRLADKGYIKYLDRIYREANLELLKSYFIVHAINDNILLLDRNYYDKVTQAEDKYTSPEAKDKGQGDVKETEIKDEWDIILNKFAMPLVGGPLNIVYISKYCSLKQKINIENIVNEVIDNYHKMIEAEEWMSDAAKAATHEKLDYLTVRAVYPDVIDSYMELEFDESDDLITMNQKIHSFENACQVKKAGQAVDKKLWNLGEHPTTVTNAYYMANDNSINIFAGIIAGENVFNVDSPDEVNYARIGTIIGHEISHAFDSTGCYYDKDGFKNTWWDSDNMTAFQLRVNKLVNYYSGITPYPGARNLMGLNVQGEAIADMGGMNVILMTAKSRTDFDYDLFFRSYAQLWRVSRSLGKESAYADMDVHPLNYLRTNVTLTQFDEFMDTYGIKEGDGMYCAPDKRIKVW